MPHSIVSIGMATIDHLYRLKDVSHLPEGRVTEYSIQGGGPAATAAAAIARLGANCGLITTVGDDQRGQDALSGLEEYGVDVSKSVVKDGATPMVLVLVDAQTGERHFLALQTNPPRIDADDIDWDYVSEAQIVHIDNWIPDATTVLKKAHELGKTTMIDTEFREDHDSGYFPYLDVYVAGSDRPEWRENPPRAIEETERIVDKGPHTAILTLGCAGCAGVGPEGPFHVNGFEVDVVDTCGTGDVFHGSYAWALNQGWTARQCAVFASATAAISATCLGGRAGLPPAEKVAHFLKSRGQTGPWEQIETDEQ
ncbi:MAG: carbohydrate kinase family protein [Candidatus Brocadiia bacterium]